MTTALAVDAREHVRQYINDNCFLRTPADSAFMPRSSGKPGFSKWMIYLRRAFYDPKIMTVIANDFFDKFGKAIETGSVQLAGVENSAVPLLVAFSMFAAARNIDLNVFSIRKEPKKHGAQNWIEGRVLKKKVLLIDDITSQGHATTNHALDIFDRFKLEAIPYTYCVVYKTRTPDKGIWWRGKPYGVLHMFKLEEFQPVMEDYIRAKSVPALCSKT